MSDWGTPTEGEVDGVLQELLKRHPESIQAAESIYGISKDNRSAFRESIRHAMSAGGIRRIDGARWGASEMFKGGVVISEKATMSITPEEEPITASKDAFVTGLWDLALHPEPQVSSNKRISPGAHMIVEETCEVDGKEWTRVTLDDGKTGWLEGAPEKDTTAKSGMISHFCSKDTRSFFITRDETKSRIGFILHWPYSGADHRGSGGELTKIFFTTADEGQLVFPLNVIQRIEIDRKREVPVKLTTRTRSYKSLI